MIWTLKKHQKAMREARRRTRPDAMTKDYLKRCADGGPWVSRSTDWEKIYIKPDMFPMGQEPLWIHEDEHGTYYYEEEQPDDGRLMAGDSNGGK